MIELDAVTTPDVSTVRPPKPQPSMNVNLGGHIYHVVMWPELPPDTIVLAPADFGPVIIALSKGKP